jgi:sugar phosphate isomerase/epimerase
LGEVGFATWELILEGQHVLKDYSKVRDLAGSYNLEISIHAPFSDLNIASLNERIRQESLAQVFEAIKVGDFLNAKLVNIHPGRLSPLGLFFKEKAWETNIQSLKEIVDFAGGYEIQICLENTPNYFGVFCCEIEEIKRVLEQVERDSLKLTLDIGHANTCGKVGEFIKELKGGIFHVHVHDNDGKDDLHAEVGTGNINFVRIFRMLRKIGYENCVIVETQGKEEAFRSKTKIEEITGST